MVSELHDVDLGSLFSHHLVWLSLAQQGMSGVMTAMRQQGVVQANLSVSSYF